MTIPKRPFEAKEIYFIDGSKRDLEEGEACAIADGFLAVVSVGGDVMDFYNLATVATICEIKPPNLTNGQRMKMC